MLGLIHRSFQFFVIDTWGVDAWERVTAELGLPLAGFEAMLTYDEAEFDALIDCACRQLELPRFSMLEDLGTYLVAHERQAKIRRLLRFSGANFCDFLASLEEMADRAHLVLPDLDLPGLVLSDQGAGLFRLHVASPISGAGHVIIGLLRAMADDYGALVLFDHLGMEGKAEVLSIQIADHALYEARPFSLGMSA
jgi:hypothetical protein